MNQAYYIGLMSGTSLDGIDAVLASFEPNFHVHGWHSTPLDPALRDAVLALTQPGDNEIERLAACELALAHAFSTAVKDLIAKVGMDSRQIHAIGSHGQTLRHLPALGYSLQAGDPNLITELTGITTVADFRRRDLAAGGQGAPLVPAFHHYLFACPDQNRIIINIGGMANITLLPATQTMPILGYDTGPGNVLLDYWCQTRHGRPYDAEGQWGASGQVHQNLLTQLLDCEYMRQPPPKSTGRELFHGAWLEAQLKQLNAPVAAEDVQATLIEFTARTLADAIKCHGLQQAQLFVCGGGSHNTQLLTRLSCHLDCSIETTAAVGLNPDQVEACAFAWLAWRAMRHETGNLPEVTGARGMRILGGIYQA